MRQVLLDGLQRRARMLRGGASLAWIGVLRWRASPVSEDAPDDLGSGKGATDLICDVLEIQR